ncbi:hypothetical protein P5E90_11860 [Clostridium perfringens]|uniref:hypothetical protein n=1 Tax=Clostridium perfringens TaxID=1502 RepID=UPI0013E3099D|nr:hypothetical protein [Clostridium perfringens]MDK0621528.1 hypothetical protein [Clostridium perfringens]NGS95713.1 hypothetical protein [Clostridium perfringens]
MKVKELIKKLQQLDQDREIYKKDFFNGGELTLSDIESISTLQEYKKIWKEEFDSNDKNDNDYIID